MKPTLKQLNKRPSLWLGFVTGVYILYPCGRIEYGYENGDWDPVVGWSMEHFILQEFVGWL